MHWLAIAARILKDMTTVESLMETVLHCVAPTKFNYPQMMLAVSCKAKHVPKSIRKTLEAKKQSAPDTNMRRLMKYIRQSSSHATHIAAMISQHGLVGARICCISGDNFQRCYRKTASASAVDPTKDSAHIVFNSAIKLGDTRPQCATDMMRPTLDPTIPTKSAASAIKYGVTPDRLYVDDPMGTIDPTDMVLIKHASLVCARGQVLSS